MHTSEHNFSGDEDQKHNPGLDHSIDESRKQFRFVAAELTVCQDKTFQSNRKFDITAAHHVLNFEVQKLGLLPKKRKQMPSINRSNQSNQSQQQKLTYIKSEFLNDASIFASSQSRLFFRLGPRADHLARAEDQRRRTRLSNAHDDGGKSFGIVFGIARMKGNFLQVKLAAQIYRGNNVLQLRNDAGIG